MNQSDSGLNWKAGLALSLFTAILWGFLPVIVKGAVVDFDPFTATWFRFAGASALFGLWLAHRCPEALVPQISKASALTLLLAVLGMSGNFSLYALSLKYQSPTVTQTVMQLGPPIIFIGGAVLFKERIGWLQWLGLAALLPGLALFFNTRLEEIFSSFGGQSLGIVFTAMSACSFATYSLSQKSLMRSLRPESVLFIALLCGTFILLPFTDITELARASATGIVLLVLAIFNTILAFVCFGEALRVWTASRVGAIVALPPLICVVATHFVSMAIPGYVQPEGLNTLSILGAALVVCGCMMGALGRGKAPTKEDDDAEMAPME